MADHDIPYYLDYLPEPLLAELERGGQPVAKVPGLTVAPGLRESFPDIETDEALSFVCELYRRTRDDLREVLDKRGEDRAFIDRTVADCVERNAARDYRAPEYETPIGSTDEDGRVVIGPLAEGERVQSDDIDQVEVPGFMQGIQVTLFGPPDTAKMSINAMNALHRRSPDEPALVTELVEASGAVPRWGADNEDSKTPIMRNFLHACENLTGCFDGTLRFVDEARGKSYELADDKLSKPIKRIPGLALPDGNHLLDGEPLPLHLVDFALHLFHNWQHPEALVFYVPKLENEEEAAYVKTLIEQAEQMIEEQHPAYELGSIKLFIVFENPRAIFRIREIAAALSPHFIGGSLGWHDFLASTARVFRRDPRYRIPVKADPNIVINHIKESHEILAGALGPIGAISIGGMYGVLFEGGNQASFEVSMVGYVKDVTAQLKRGLDGFWVAHPDFVRPGIALVEAFQRWKEDPSDDVLERLIEQLVPDDQQRAPLLEFVFGDDVNGLPEDDPLYLRGVLAANVETSDVIRNDDPEEVRYNVFQAVQYLADWLSGNGCVALPATMENARGEEVFVRIMDDLATTERSRWELWAEIAHGRVSGELFDQILDEELAFIREGRQTPTKRVQVAWEGEAARWYPIAARLLRQLATADEPPEFATELLLPFTLDCVREADDAWEAVCELCPGKYVHK
jgi:malate synthase